MGLFEGLTVPAKQVLARATEAAASMGSHEVDGAHLILGFLVAGDTPAGQLLAARLPAPSVVAAEVQRLTLPSRNGQHPAFGQEVCLALAAARGIAVGRRCAWVGSGACLLGLLTLAPHSVEELLAALHIDRKELESAGAGLDVAAEPIGPPPAQDTPWTVTIGASGPLAWDDR